MKKNSRHFTQIRRLITLLVAALSAIGTIVDAQTQRTYRAPLLSTYDSVQAVTALTSRLNQIFTSSVYSASKISVKVWSVDRDVQLYARNPDQCLTPASTTKLFSTAAYYQLTGIGSTINTDVRIDGVIQNGVLRGDLYLVGGGDALLSVNDLEDLADKVRALGIRKISGNIYGDGSAFDGQTNRAVYSGDYEDVQPLPPIVALTVNKGTIAVMTHVSNGRVSAQAIPASRVVSVRSKVVAAPTKARSTSKKKAPAPRRKKKNVSKRNGDAPPYPVRRRRPRSMGGRVWASSSVTPEGTQIINISGSPGRNRTVTLYVAMARPAAVTAGVFADRLESGGVEFTGTVGERKAPFHAKTVSTFARPFSSFASIVNKRSDNYLAEHVFKMVGARCGDHSTTSARAKKAMLECLDTLGVRRNGCSFNDGSGLSRRNTVSATTQVDLLRTIHRQPWGKEYRSTLAVASYDGTIRRRMVGTPAANNVTAKTGTLRNVSALSGYVTTRDGELLAFCFISNGPYVGAYKGAENLAAAALASFTYNQKSGLLPTDVLPDSKTPMPDEELQDEE